MVDMTRTETFEERLAAFRAHQRARGLRLEEYEADHVIPCGRTEAQPYRKVGIVRVRKTRWVRPEKKRSLFGEEFD